MKHDRVRVYTPQDIDTAEVWLKICVGGGPYFVYINREGYLSCIKENTVEFLYLKRSLATLVGVYDKGISKADFTEDVEFAFLDRLWHKETS